MQKVAFERMYVLLRPHGRTGGGYARLEQLRGKYVLTVSAHGFSPKEEGVRLLFIARDEKNSIAVTDLGILDISSHGQAALRREIGAQPGGIPLSSYSAVCLAKDWPAPKLLLAGMFKERSPLSTYLMEEAIRHHLSVPSQDTPEVSSAPNPASTAPKPEKAQPSAPVAPAPSAPAAPPKFPTVMISPQTATAPAESSSKNIPANSLPPFPLPGSAASAPAGIPAAALTASPDGPGEEDVPGIYKTLAQEPADADAFSDAIGIPALPVSQVTPGDNPPHSPSVMALPKLFWPEGIRELEGYFTAFPPFAPFDAPGWRFVQVPMSAGSTIPYYAVGMLARDGKVAQVAYAVPGERGTLPPAGFVGYRWQQGRNGQGYWTLWKKA